jgi:myo-inositol-1(or 4)-monophosphatase
VKNPTLTEIEDLARKAGEILLRGYNPQPGQGSHLHIDHKGEIDLVTDVDRRSEAFILDYINRHYPDHRVIAEESGHHAGNGCCVWYVDPLDGTINYAHGVPLFAVSIGYQEDGELKYGVVYDPIHAECFSAEKGNGAHLNGAPLRVSNRHELLESLLVTGFPYDIRTNPVNNLDHYAQLSLVSQGVRRLGAAALDLCYVAAGRLDGFWEIRISSWDVTAGALIAQEAGALVTNMDGGTDFLSDPPSILVANPQLHAKILEILRKPR